MMEYTGRYRTVKNSTICGEDVDILEYESDTKLKVPYCYCDRCGKPIMKKMYVVQSSDTALIHFNLGSECIKHFS